jgi:hypothetical protein
MLSTSWGRNRSSWPTWATMRVRGFPPQAGSRQDSQICNLQGQTPLDLLHTSGTLPDKLPQRLHIGPFDPSSHGFDGFALPLEQKPLRIRPGPATPLALTHGLQKIFQELAQPPIKRFKLFTLHGHKNTITATACQEILSLLLG